MANRFHPFIFLCLLVGGIAVSAPALSQESPPPIDKSQAATRAQQLFKGRVLKVEHHAAQRIYRVKVLQKSGRVVSVDIDTHSGEVSPPAKRKEK